jgi:hypothetical protein
MEKKEHDLGFFNGIKSELIPLIAGLVSFTLLVNTAVNQIEDIFSVGAYGGILIFVFLYFITPSFFILSWVFWLNNKDGLKNRLFEVPKSPISITVIGIGLLLLLCTLLFFKIGFRSYLLLICITITFILAYGFQLLAKKPKMSFTYKREYRQAAYQLCITIVGLLVLWTIYFYRYTQHPRSEFHKKWTSKAQDENLLDSMFIAGKSRNDYKDYLKSIESILAHYDDLIYLPEADLKKRSNDSIVKWVNSLKSKYLESNYKKRFSYLLKSRDSLRQKKDSIHQMLYKIQVAKLEDHQPIWAYWLQIVQFKGLLLFTTMILFLMVVWYHAYRTQLEMEDQNPYSEIWISKISIYVLFLLIIPFFKPIKKDSVSFTKPYIGSSKSIIYNDNRVINPPPQPTDSIRYLRISKIVGDTLQKVKEANKKVLDYQKKYLKKEPQKPKLPYDKKTP